MDNMTTLWDVPELIFDTNLNSGVLYDYENDNWESDNLSFYYIVKKGISSKVELPFYTR